MSATSFTRHQLELDADGGEPVPAILLLPRTSGPVAAVLLIHGFSSRKERMSDSIGRALATRGVASLAIDLPLHGARETSLEGLSLSNPLALVQKWRLALKECHRSIQYLAGRSDVDAARLGIGGYSLGAYIAVTVAAANPLVRAVALAAGGDLPAQTPFASLVRAMADPLRAVRALGGRPLFMIHGRHDRRILPDQARALYEAASPPKELHWYDGGHWPPPGAIDAVAEWLANRFGDSRRQRAG